MIGSMTIYSVHHTTHDKIYRPTTFQYKIMYTCVQTHPAIELVQKDRYGTTLLPELDTPYTIAFSMRRLINRTRIRCLHHIPQVGSPELVYLNCIVFWETFLLSCHLEEHTRRQINNNSPVVARAGYKTCTPPSQTNHVQYIQANHILMQIPFYSRESSSELFPCMCKLLFVLPRD